MLKDSDKVVLAFDEKPNQVVGFSTSVSDGALSAYIPFLEVLPAY
ncbi:acetyltransferase [Jeotgalibacillus soli]|uniref:Acetyltransferase n=1 Tax=Jeotgalibacillus soli TaxID=889306 RepID=A0A0C2V7V5_9BACL|nr:acetyltransferase [Jeotgalibacillus soli]